MDFGCLVERQPLFQQKNKRGGLSSGEEINAIVFIFTLSSGLSRGVCLSGWPLKRSSTVQTCCVAFLWGFRGMQGNVDKHKTNQQQSPRVGLVVSMSASRTLGRGFTPRPGHTKDHDKNDTNCVPARKVLG